MTNDTLFQLTVQELHKHKGDCTATRAAVVDKLTADRELLGQLVDAELRYVRWIDQSPSKELKVKTRRSSQKRAA